MPCVVRVLSLIVIHVVVSIRHTYANHWPIRFTWTSRLKDTRGPLPCDRCDLCESDRSTAAFVMVATDGLWSVGYGACVTVCARLICARRARQAIRMRFGAGGCGCVSYVTVMRAYVIYALMLNLRCSVIAARMMYVCIGVWVCVFVFVHCAHNPWKRAYTYSNCGIIHFRITYFVFQLRITAISEREWVGQVFRFCSYC